MIGFWIFIVIAILCLAVCFYVYHEDREWSVFGIAATCFCFVFSGMFVGVELSEHKELDEDVVYKGKIGKAIERELGYKIVVDNDTIIVFSSQIRKINN